MDALNISPDLAQKFAVIRDLLDNARWDDAVRGADELIKNLEGRADLQSGDKQAAIDAVTLTLKNRGRAGQIIVQAVALVTVSSGDKVSLENGIRAAEAALKLWPEFPLAALRRRNWQEQLVQLEISRLRARVREDLQRIEITAPQKARVAACLELLAADDRMLAEILERDPGADVRRERERWADARESIRRMHPPVVERERIAGDILQLRTAVPSLSAQELRSRIKGVHRELDELERQFGSWLGLDILQNDLKTIEVKVSGNTEEFRQRLSDVRQAISALSNLSDVLDKRMAGELRDFETALLDPDAESVPIDELESRSESLRERIRHDLEEMLARERLAWPERLAIGDSPLLNPIAQEVRGRIESSGRLTSESEAASEIRWLRTKTDSWMRACRSAVDQLDKRLRDFPESAALETRIDGLKRKFAAFAAGQGVVKYSDLEFELESIGVEIGKVHGPRIEIARSLSDLVAELVEVNLLPERNRGEIDNRVSRLRDTKRPLDAAEVDEARRVEQELQEIRAAAQSELAARLEATRARLLEPDPGTSHATVTERRELATRCGGALPMPLAAAIRHAESIERDDAAIAERAARRTAFGRERGDLTRTGRGLLSDPWLPVKAATVGGAESDPALVKAVESAAQAHASLASALIALETADDARIDECERQLAGASGRIEAAAAVARACREAHIVALRSYEKRLTDKRQDYESLLQAELGRELRDILRASPLPAAMAEPAEPAAVAAFVTAVRRVEGAVSRVREKLAEELEQLLGKAQLALNDARRALRSAKPPRWPPVRSAARAELALSVEELSSLLSVRGPDVIALARAVDQARPRVAAVSRDFLPIIAMTFVAIVATIAGTFLLAPRSIHIAHGVGESIAGYRAEGALNWTPFTGHGPILLTPGTYELKLQSEDSPRSSHTFVVSRLSLPFYSQTREYKGRATHVMRMTQTQVNDILNASPASDNP